MNLNTRNSAEFLTFKIFETGKFRFLRHAFSTRNGGISENEYASMNLSYSTGDLPQNVDENFKIFCDNAGFEKNMLVIPQQIHSNNVKIVSENDVVGAEFPSKQINSTDGLITDVPKVVLTTFHADCNSLFFADAERKVIGLAHAGWRGTTKMIARSMVKAFIENFGTNVKNLHCCMGPAIQKCCFEIKNDVLPNFENMPIKNVHKFIEKQANAETYKVDLFGINREILLEIGLPEENIVASDLCTKCNPNLFYSHRNMGAKRGTMAAFLCLV